MLFETPVIAGYVRWLHGLTAQSAHRVSQFTGRDTRIRTPEAEGVGAAAVGAIYAGYFADAQSVIIRVNDMADGKDGYTVYLRWDRLMTSAKGQKQSLSGVTEIMLGLDGKIAYITEHWDRVPEPMGKRSWLAKLRGR